jgi:hypothetical protein
MMKQSLRQKLFLSSSMLPLYDIASPHWAKEQLTHRVNFQILIARAEANPYDYGNASETIQ